MGEILSKTAGFLIVHQESTVTFRMTLIGLGWIGSSIGLALKQTGAEFEIVGHDKDHAAAKRAHKSGCVDRTEWNLISACDGADLVVISIPISGIQGTLAAIAQDLKQGCVVTDTASLKAPVLNWARESLPSTVHFVGGHPIVERRADPPDPAADLFAGAIYCLTPSTDAPPQAIRAVSDLVEALGAKAYYLDAVEHDGLVAALEHTPLVLALALQYMASRSPSSREMIQLCGLHFAGAMQPLAGDAQDLTDLCTLNADNLVRWLDGFQVELFKLREVVANQDSESLRESFADALEMRAKWARERLQGAAADYGDFSMARVMFGGAFGSRKQEGK